jgi:hypothetical protein
LMSSSTWLNHLVLGCPIFLILLHFNYICPSWYLCSINSFYINKPL